MKNIFFVLGLLAYANLGHAADPEQLPEIIVDADTAPGYFAAPSNTLTAEDIQRRGSATVADILREIPGLDVVASGGAGQPVAIFIRGARSEDTLVLLDGIEANDPMSPSGDFNFANLAAENIERIEIYQGPQAVRFGSGALGGVINIVTKKGTGPVAQNNLFLEAGSYQTQRLALSTSQDLEAFDYSLGISGLQTQGFSAADADLGNRENDGAKIQSLSSRIGFKTDRQLRVDWTLRLIDSRSDLDNRGGSGGDDPNYDSHFQQLLTGVQLQRPFFADRLHSAVGLFYSELDRTDTNSADLFNPVNSRNHFLSETTKFETHHEYQIDPSQKISLAYQRREESGTGTSTYSGFPDSAFARQQRALDGESTTYTFDRSLYFAQAGLRLDQYSPAAHSSNYQLVVGLKPGSYRPEIKLSYGSGFKAPSLYQLYSSAGPSVLQAESSHATELSIRQNVNTSSQLAVVLFDNQYQNLIDFNLATSQYYNVNSARSRGAELNLDWDLNDWLHLAASTQYLEAKDNETQLNLLRRPQRVHSLQARFTDDHFESSFSYRWTATREDIDPVSFTRTDLPSYELVTWTASYKFTKTYRLGIRAENLLNKKYQEVAGYGTSGQAFYLSLQTSL